jgi:hypothetical protein
LSRYWAKCLRLHHVRQSYDGLLLYSQSGLKGRPWWEIMLGRSPLLLGPGYRLQGCLRRNLASLSLTPSSPLELPTTSPLLQQIALPLPLWRQWMLNPPPPYHLHAHNTLKKGAIPICCLIFKASSPFLLILVLTQTKILWRTW